MELYDGCTGKHWTDKNTEKGKPLFQEAHRRKNGIFGFVQKGKAPVT